MTAKPETLRVYAAILELPFRSHDGIMRESGEISKAAAEALRFQADALERLAK